MAPPKPRSLPHGAKEPVATPLLALAPFIWEVLDLVERGSSVRIVGPAGSGRTTVMRAVVAVLEKSGATVHTITGMATHRPLPLSVTVDLCLDIKAGHGGVQTITDVFSRVLGTSGEHVLAVDNIHLLDPETLAVLEAVLRRSGCRLIATAPDGMPQKAQLAVLNIGREAIVRLTPLNIRQVQATLAQVLGAPVADETVASILAASGGNPRFVVRIAETSLMSGLLSTRRQPWRIRAGSPWNRHLRGTIEALLVDLSEEEITALRTSALLGSAPMDVLERITDPRALHALERHGLVRVLENSPGQSTVAVDPPLIADYFRDQSTLRDRLLTGTGSSEAAAREPESSTPDLEPGVTLDTRLKPAHIHNIPTTITAVMATEPAVRFGTLTQRETHIASMAGLCSNLQIAKQLGISPRTVENHISKALRKTGTVSRSALFSLVSGDPAPLQ